MQRRLAAILAADVVGYSKLMSEDEAGTLQALRVLRGDILAPTIETHRGRIIKSMGDGWLVEFSSAGDAVTCAIEVQQALKGNEALALRMGVHIGDITFTDEDLFGNGVNIAARLQELAEPGAIVLSDFARRTLDGKVASEFNSLGHLHLKNIPEAVLGYGWGMTAAGKSARYAARIPSLAVLPFDTLADDPEQAFFSNGIAEDVITNLSKVPGLNVIARSSTTSAKRQADGAVEIGRLLNARYVLHGSLRQNGSRLRLAVHLIDSKTDNPIWAERYDRMVKDLFDLQDELVREIVTALRIQLTDGELAALMNRGTNNVEAWRLLFEGYEIMWALNASAMLRARELSSEACKLDPEYALAWGVLGFTYWYEARIGPLEHQEKIFTQAEQYLEKAFNLDPNHPDIAGFYGGILVKRRRYQEVVKFGQENLKKNPGSATSRAHLANIYHFNGNHEQAIQLHEEAKQLNPLHPIWYFPMSARALDAYGDQEAALHTVRAGLARQPDNFPCLLQLASLLGRNGELKEAQEVLSRLRLLSPDFTLKQVEQWLMMNDAVYVSRFTEGLRKAGLPE